MEKDKNLEIFGKAGSWSELERKIAAIPSEKGRGDAFEKFCEAYLRLIPEYRFKDIWLQGRYPRWVIEKLCLTGQKDQGIDLVAVTDDDKLWAIQAKFRSDRAATVPYRELSTFLGISDRADYRLIISNTLILPTVVQNRGHCGEVLADRLDALDRDFFKRLAEFSQGREPVPVKPFIPKEHQRNAIQAAVKHFAKEDRGQLIMACGTGKTLASVWIAEHLNSKAILVMVPSLALMRQTVSVWAKNYKKAPLNYFCICSDDSVAHDIKSDYAISHLWEMDIPVTTDPLEAGRFIHRHAKTPFIVFSTYQSSIVLSKAVSKVKGFKFDLIISDEAHRTAGMTKGLFNHVLDNRHIPSRKRLFMTATPRILAKHIIKRGMEEDVELFSMADETKYGREFYRVSFGDAIKRKLLTDYKVVIAVITDDELRKIVQQKAQVQIISKGTYEREAENLAKQVAYLKALKNYGIRHTISYHSRVSFAQAFSAPENACGIHAVNRLVKSLGKDVPELQAFHVNGMMPAGERSAILKDFAEAPFSVVSNARCLTEGVDIPSVDGVLFFDPKYRLTDIVQATGRAIRLHPGKEYGYLIVPVFIKEDEDVETALESSDFSQVWSVIKAMQSQDERLDEVISKLRTLDGKIKGGNRELSSTRSSAEEKLFEKIQVFNVPRKVSARKFVKAVETQLFENLGRSWDFMYGLLFAFRNKNPNNWPLQSLFYGGDKLGIWCSTQRQRRKKGVLSQERIEKLNEIGFPWTPKEEGWESAYSLLTGFRRKNPNKWPLRSLTYKGIKLGLWCDNQRQRKHILSKDKIYRLNLISFPWHPEEEAWEHILNLLKEYRKTNSDTWPINSLIYKNVKLGIWCSTQRARKKRLTLSKREKKKLNQIGFQWDPKRELTWDYALNLLRQFRKENPNIWPSIFLIYKQFRLGNWCFRQRQCKKIGILSKDRLRRLDKIGFPWLPLDESWQHAFKLLKEFGKENPDRWPSNTLIYKDVQIGAWCNTQRSRRKKGLMPQDRIDKLDKIGFSWSPFDEAWEIGFNLLKKFGKENPNEWPIHSLVYENFKLGNWCKTLRLLNMHGRLSQDRVKKLNQLNFVWNPLEYAWSHAFNLLKKFRKENPDKWPSISLIYKNFKLGIWCFTQRQRRKNRTLLKEEIKKLDNLGFPWAPRGEAWERVFRLLKEFRGKNPKHWPLRASSFKGFRLDSWCSNQRTRRNSLSKRQIERLDQIGFPWQPASHAWDLAFNLLKEFRNTNPSKWPPQTLIYKKIKLGIWCASQRERRKKRISSKDEIKKLNQIGFPWDPEYANWEHAFKLLKKFRKENPNKWPSSLFVYKKFRIGGWCYTQRQRKKQGTISQEEMDKLDHIGFPWSPFDKAWEVGFSFLKKFKKENSDIWPMQTLIYKKFKLGTWCSRQRRLIKLQKLSRDRMKKLNEARFSW